MIKLSPEQERRNKLINNMKRDLERSLDIESFRDLKSIVLVVIPQVQLSPYVHAVLFGEGLLFSRRIILMHPRSTKLSSELFSPYPNVSQLEIGFANEIAKDYLQELYAHLSSVSADISTYVLHNFAGTITQVCAEHVNSGVPSLDITCPSKVIFYADGSRNNAKPELSGQFAGGFHSDCQRRSAESSLYHFGFVHHTSALPDSSIRLLPYNYLEASFAASTRLSTLRTATLEQSTKYSMVLTRYWGRVPYFFDENVDILELFIRSIGTVISTNSPLILRDDNRFQIPVQDVVDKLKTQGYEVRRFDEFFDVVGAEHKTLLLENFILDNPEFLLGIESVYCFDSSFPLIFQNKKLYQDLPPEVKIYVGFDRIAVNAHGKDECYSVMRLRTVETVLSVCSCQIFNVFDEHGLVYSPSLETPVSIDDLFDRFDTGNGYFCMMKS